MQSPRSILDAPHQGRDVVTNYLPWLSLNDGHVDLEDVVTGNLKQLNLRSSGSVGKREDAEVDLQPLVFSSELAMEIEGLFVGHLPQAHDC